MWKLAPSKYVWQMCRSKLSSSVLASVCCVFGLADHELHEALDRTGSARWLSPLAPGSHSLSLPIRLRDAISACNLQPAFALAGPWPARGGS
jgi:hypothetical protein